MDSNEENFSLCEEQMRNEISEMKRLVIRLDRLRAANKHLLIIGLVDENKEKSSKKTDEPCGDEICGK